MSPRKESVRRRCGFRCRKWTGLAPRAQRASRGPRADFSATISLAEKRAARVTPGSCHGGPARRRKAASRDRTRWLRRCGHPAQEVSALRVVRKRSQRGRLPRRHGVESGFRRGSLRRALVLWHFLVQFVGSGEQRLGPIRCLLRLRCFALRLGVEYFRGVAFVLLILVIVILSRWKMLAKSCEV